MDAPGLRRAPGFACGSTGGNGGGGSLGWLRLERPVSAWVRVGLPMLGGGTSSMDVGGVEPTRASAADQGVRRPMGCDRRRLGWGPLALLAVPDIGFRSRRLSWRSR